MQKIISYKCGNEASFTKNIFRQLDRAERCPVTLNFLEGWKMWKRFHRCYYFFWSQSQRKTFKRNPDLQVSILSLEWELQNGIHSIYCTSHFHQERSVFGWSSVVSFPERNSPAHVHDLYIFRWWDQPYLLISQLDSETPVMYGCKSWTQFN